MLKIVQGGVVTELNFNSLENFHGWTVVLHGQGLLHRVAISLEKFRGTDQSVKTTKRLYLKWFAIYSIINGEANINYKNDENTIICSYRASYVLL